MGWRWSLSASTYSVRSNEPLWEQDGHKRQHCELKNSGSNLYSSHRRARTPGSISIYWLMARVNLRPFYMDKVLYPEGKWKNINGNDKKGNSTGFGRGWPDPSPMLDNDTPASQCFTRTGGCLNVQSRARWSFCNSHCSSASFPRVHRAAVWAGSDPSDRSLWATLPGSGSNWTAQAIAASPGEYWQEGERDVGIKQRLRSAREQEGTKENRQETYSASCCSGKVYLRPSGKPHLPQGQDSPSTSPKGGPGPHYSQTSVPGASFGHWKNECPKARKEEEAPAVVGLADLEIN